MDEDGESVITVELSDGTMVAVLAEQIGSELVANEDLAAKFETVTRSIQVVGRDVLAAVKAIKPNKATVELGFGLAVEAGQLIALFGRGKGEATIKVTLEWVESPG